MKNKLLTVILMSALSNVAALVYYGAWAAEGDNFSLATGFDYSSGKYGSDITTTILSIPVVGMYSTGLWAFELTVPYVRISGDGSVVPGMGGVVPGMGGPGGKGPMGSTTATASTTRSGLGDVVAAASYNLYSGSENNFRVDLTGKIKFGTAGTALGTGQNDYAAQADVYKSFDGFTAMGALGYEVLGSPAGVSVNNVAYGSLGGYYQITDQTGGGAELSLSQKASAISAEQRELTAYVSHSFDESLKIRGYVLKGFANGSPDSGFGVLVSSDL